MWGYGLRTVLPPEPTSAGRARSFVTSALGSLGLEDLLDAAELCTSELVTNALVHGRTQVGIAVRTTGHGVRVEVRDGCANGPLPKHYEGLAPTGRGLQLVADLACAVGVEYEDHSGKTIWFELDGPRRGRDAGGNAWASTEASEEQEQEAVLLGLPVRLWTAAQQHHDEMLRELLLHRLELDGQGAFALRSDLSEAEEAQTLLSAAFERSRSGGAVADDERLDVHVCFTPTQVSAFTALRDVLDDAERLADTGQLLALAAQPEVVALREWCCGEVVAQARGRPPTPWETVCAPVAEASGTEQNAAV